MELDELKSGYKKVSGRYKIPLFKDLNECFEIDRIERYTDCILREVRKTMMDKIIGYIKFIEMIINPAQAPPMFMMFVKSITPDEKKIIDSVYEGFVELELRSLKLEIDYSEKAEAETIKIIFDTWNSSRENLRKVIGIMEKNWKSVGSEKKIRDYFG